MWGAVAGAGWARTRWLTSLLVLVGAVAGHAHSPDPDDPEVQRWVAEENALLAEESARLDVARQACLDTLKDDHGLDRRSAGLLAAGLLLAGTFALGARNRGRKVLISLAAVAGAGGLALGALDHRQRPGSQRSAAIAHLEAGTWVRGFAYSESSRAWVMDRFLACASREPGAVPSRPDDVRARLVEGTGEVEVPVPFGWGMTRPVFDAGGLSADVYTPEALQDGIKGEFIVKCIVFSNGEVRGCRVMKPLYEISNDVVMERLRATRMVPATMDGRPIAVEYVFNLHLEPPAQAQ